MTHMVNTSFSPVIKPRLPKYQGTRMVNISVIMSDADTGEILWHNCFKTELFGGSKSAENRLADIFASCVRGARIHDSINLSLTIVPLEEELPIVGF